MIKLDVDKIKELDGRIRGDNYTIDIYRLSEIIRYNNMHKLKHESVATHTFYVSYYTMVLSYYIKLEPEVKAYAYEYSLIHDVCEVITNDITYDAKKMFPSYKTISDVIEQNIKDDVFKLKTNVSIEKQKLAQAVVKAADIISVLLYTTNEVKLGNNHMVDWPEDTMNRLEVQLKIVNELVDEINKSEIEGSIL